MRSTPTAQGTSLAISLMAAAVLTLSAGVRTDVLARPAEPSTGCASDAYESGTYEDERLAVGDTDKPYALHVPSSYDGTTPLPLWVQLHGVGGSGRGQVSKLGRDADRLGFVLAAPTERLGNAGWGWREEDAELDVSLANPDIALIDGLIDELARKHCLDLARVYVGGYSGGGEGASVVACVLEQKVAAVAPSAAMLDVGDACELDRPVPFLAVHSPDDRTAFFDGGYSPGYNGFPVVQALAQTSIPERVANVAARNGCRPGPTVESLDGGRELWSWSCPVGAEVQMLTHGYGHSWGPPGTTDQVWAFFADHPMPQ